MLVWGGQNSTGELDSGGRYDPEADSWTTITLVGAPAERAGHALVWTGSRMVVWGGASFDGGFHNYDSGGLYDPQMDQWTPTSLVGAPSARITDAAWTGQSLVVWGGSDLTGVVDTGATYDPISDTWATMSLEDAPSARTGHTLQFCGVDVIVWGGIGSGFPNTGGAYKP
jgi:hypothetical protein